MSVLLETTPDSGLGTFPRVNLLPPEIGVAKQTRIIRTWCAGSLGAVVLAVAGLVVLASHGVSSAQSDLATSQQDRSRAQVQVHRYDEVATTRTRVDAAQGIVTTARSGEVRWSQSLADLSRNVPAGVWLTRVTVAAATPSSTPTARSSPSASPSPSSASASASRPTSSAGAATNTAIATITVTGNALHHDDVATWLDDVATQKGWAQPYFSESTQTQIGGRPVEQFTSTIDVTRDVLRHSAAAPGASR